MESIQGEKGLSRKIKKVGLEHEESMLVIHPWSNDRPEAEVGMDDRGENWSRKIHLDVVDVELILKAEGFNIESRETTRLSTDL